MTELVLCGEAGAVGKLLIEQGRLSEEFLPQSLVLF